MGPSDTPPETNDRGTRRPCSWRPHCETLFSRHRIGSGRLRYGPPATPEEASDGLQDAMISAFRNAASYRGEAAVTTWLHRVVVNACLDRLRRKRSRPTVPLPGTDAETGRDNLPDPRDDIGSLSWGWRSRRLWRRCRRSNGRPSCWWTSRATAWTRAAEMLGCPSGTIKSRCARSSQVGCAIGHPEDDPPDPSGNYAQRLSYKSRAPQGR